MNHRTLKAAAIALVSWLALCAVTWSTPQGLHFYDPVVQLRALQQHQRGESPAWNVWMRVDPTDLSHDIAEPVGWWPPSIPIFVQSLTAGFGLDFGRALRVIVIVAGAAGAVGWAAWWTRFPLPTGWILALAAVVPWLRFVSSEFFRFSGDVFAFAAVPWIFLGLTACLTRLQRRATPAAGLLLTGLFVGFSYWFKYSLFVTALAGLGATGLLAWRAAGDWRRVVRPLLILASAAAAVPLAVKIFNATHGALDPAGRINEANIGPSLLLFFFANPALGLADAAGPYFQALVQPGFAGFGGHDLTFVAWIGLPGGLLLAWLLGGVLSQPEPPAAVALAATTLPIFALLMLAMWLTSDVARDTRLFTPTAFAALPVALLAGRMTWSQARVPLRVALLLALLVYLAVPVAYGPVYVALKIAETRAIQPGTTGLNLPSLGAFDRRALLSALRPEPGSSAVWIVENLEASLDLPGRSLTPISGRSIAEDMRNIYRAPGSLSHWRTSALVELRVLSTDFRTPPALVTTLRGASRWIPYRVPASKVVIWTATMRPVPRTSAAP